VVEEDGVRLDSIEGELDVAFREEGYDPITEGWWKASVAEDVDNACDVNIVEEALNVKKNHRCD